LTQFFQFRREGLGPRDVAPLRTLVPAAQQDDQPPATLRDAFHHRLRNQDAVERILVQCGQPADGQGVQPNDGEFDAAVVQRPPAEQPSVNLEVVAPAPVLDDHLPTAG